MNMDEIMMIKKEDKREAEENKKMKVIIAGCACVVFSELTPEEIERFKRYRPDALTMCDESNPENTFTMDIDDGPGKLEDSTAVFSRTKSAEGKATITVLLDPEEEDKLSMVRENLGLGLIRLRELEAALLNRRDELADAEKKVNEMLTLM